MSAERTTQPRVDDGAEQDRGDEVLVRAILSERLAAFGPTLDMLEAAARAA
jgi:hypothetical protein